MNIFIFNYNNYYNRILKINNTIEKYGMPIHALYDVKDFNSRDMVNTEHLFGSNINSYDGSGDYAVITDENNTIISRWFIIEATFLRQGQWKLILRRDLLADFYNEVINADTFIEKATLAYDDPLVFNNENFEVNQIKTNETLLMDSSKCAWLVGYYNRDASSFTITVPSNEETTADKIVLTTPISSWSYYKYTNESTPFEGGIQECSYEILVNNKINTDTTRYTTEYKTGSTTEYLLSKKRDTGLTLGNNILFTEGRYALESQYQGFLTTLESQLRGYISYAYSSEVESFLELNGKLVEDSNGKVFRITLGNTNTIHKSANITNGSMFNTLSSMVAGTYYNDKKCFTGTPNNESFKVGANITTYTLKLTEVSQQAGITATVSDQRVTCEDAPWNIFAIPFGKVTVKNAQGTTIVTTDGDVGLKAAMTLATGSIENLKLYDLQILPYCPFGGLQNNGNIIISNTNEYDLIGETNNPLSIILHIQYSKFTRTLYGYAKSYNMSAIGKKINNECDKWRLTSPNYSNYFDFSVEKNLGVASFNIDCEYKPYTPYIHINPDFKGLYGYDDNSPRGLVCGGDYSLSQAIEQWAEYQRQNKNYQLTFDRQIQNMEIKNDIIRQMEKWQVGVGAATGALSGGATGALVGGGYGAAAGAIMGAGASLAGGIADIKYNETLRNESMDYTKDLFGYQLQNIQALPATISKVSALNNNNKIFPILEFYTCTEREKNAFLNKIAFNGMTVMAIGKISDYLGNNWTYNGISSKGYIKGKIIRLNIPGQDFHLINEISGEIFKGVYTIWE